MKAAIMRNAKIVVDEMAMPVPSEHEVLVKTLACGICGSDLHALKHGHDMVQTSLETGGSFVMDLSKDVVMGHEFCAEVLDYGPNTSRNLKPGTRVCSFPTTVHNGALATVGYSNAVPGGYSENMVLTESMLLPVPNGLSTAHAALTEPMAVGLHAVRMAKLNKSEVPLVIGCGPVGLAVIAALKQAGVGPIIAVDYSAKRRELAELMGADEIIDPSNTSPYDCWKDIAKYDAHGSLMPIEPFSGQSFRQGVFFECVGVPGVIDQIMAGAPSKGRIVVVGVCMEADQIRPLTAINKELNLQFVLGYQPEEFAETLHNIAEGHVNVAPLITSTVGLDGVAQAFEDLADPERHAKILVDPTL
jgi:2-desacetyl-2-hydroxyethyl bacteriochlorophyllide A dehydrogenase